MKIENSDSQEKISPIVIMGSIMAASFGVQTQANRERDFKRGRFHHFIIGGIVFTFFFVLLLVGVVKLIMHFSGV